MNVHVLQHAPFEGLGCITAWLRARQAEVTTTRFFEQPTLPPLRGLDFVIAMGGPMSVNDEAEFPWLRAEKHFIREAVQSDVPVLGICLGSQLIASALGARVHRNPQKEIGWFPVQAVPAEGDVFRFPDKLQAFHWHGETFDLPSDAIRLASSAACANQAFQVGRRTLALQFHIEISPEAVRAFVEHCAAEISPAPYIQSIDEVLAAPDSLYAEANAGMCCVLDYLVGKTERRIAPLQI